MARARYRNSIGVWDVKGRPPDAQKLWCEYAHLSRTDNQFLRVGARSILYALFGWTLFELLGGTATPPARGDGSHAVDALVRVGSVGLQIVLIFYVVDVTRLCEVFSRKLAGDGTPWPADVRRHFAAKRRVDEEDVGDWLDIRVIAERTDVVGRLILPPFIVLALMILSRISYFDRWDWPPALVLIFALNSVYAVACALVLRRTAERARRDVLRRLNAKFVRLKRRVNDADLDARKDDPVVTWGGAGPADAKTLREVVRVDNAARAEQVKLLIDEIAAIRQGAFAPWSQNPLVAAVLIPTGGIGTWSLLEMLATWH
jgi:hypothetical protein